jgi:hypothetical protein
MDEMSSACSKHTEKINAYEIAVRKISEENSCLVGRVIGKICYEAVKCLKIASSGRFL